VLQYKWEREEDRIPDSDEECNEVMHLITPLSSFFLLFLTIKYRWCGGISGPRGKRTKPPFFKQKQALADLGNRVGLLLWKKVGIKSIGYGRGSAIIIIETDRTKAVFFLLNVFHFSPLLTSLFRNLLL